MKIYSWNVLYTNKRIPEITEYIKNLDFDVLCLQEVSSTLLDGLKAQEKNLACTFDVRDDHGLETNLVIVSKHPILKTEAYEVPYPSIIKFRTWLTMRIMSVIDGWHPMKGKGALSAEVSVNGKTIRVYCVHLTIMGPTFRAKEFDITLKRRATNMPEIIAGDLNIVEHPFIKIYSWLLGSPLKEGMPWFPERTNFNKTLAYQNLSNPLAGRITHPFSASQLDHILLSPEFKATKSWVEMDSHGSDHQPVGVECEL